MAKYLLIVAVIALLAAVRWYSQASNSQPAETNSVAAMSDDERTNWFWGIIERTRSPDGDQDRQRAALAAELSKFSPAEIEAFGAVFDRLLTETYSWDLWGAAYVTMPPRSRRRVEISLSAGERADSWRACEEAVNRGRGGRLIPRSRPGCGQL